MDDITCHCDICCQKHPKSELRERKTDIYPYKRTIYLCKQCNEKRNKRNALKTAKSGIKKPVNSAHYFKW